MFDHDTMTEQQQHHEGHSDDSGYTASPASPSQFADFEVLEYKPQPCSMDNTEVSESLPVFEEPSTLHVPTLVPETKRFPIVLLERCDKIWETLQLIKVVQNKSPEIINNHSEEEEEKMPDSSEIEQAESYVKSRSTSKTNKKLIPFTFLVQRTKKLFPCVTCGKQYLERRSLRNHSERVHGIILPLLKSHKRRKNYLKSTNNMNLTIDNSVALPSKENNSEKVYNRDSFGITTELKTPELITDEPMITEPVINPSKKSKSMISDMDSINDQFKTDPSSVKTDLAKCALCGKEVKSVKNHLINYHKIGFSSNMMKQLESSLSVKTETSSKPEQRGGMLKYILSGKPQIPTNKNTQNEFRVMNNEDKAHETSQVRRKRKYTFSYVSAKKRLKLDTERYMTMQNTPSIVQKHSLNITSYKCDICLGMYSSANSYNKHRRIHRIRGETKENFHKFKCRYNNSPLNKKYQLSRSSTEQTNAVTTNTNLLLNQNGRKSSRINRLSTYGGKMKANRETTCICGRSFRNPHTLFVHKNTCKLCNRQDYSEVRYSTRSRYSAEEYGNGINITIKKRNNSYEIVGKDSDEDKLEKSDNFKDDILKSNASDDFTKNSTNAQAKQLLNTSDGSEYSKKHSILKLKDADEDVIIDVEDDIQFISKNYEIKQKIMPKNLKKQQNNMENNRNEKSFNKVPTLKEICQDVLETHKSESTTICQENKRNLRSSNQIVKKKYYYSDDETDTCTTKLDLSTCGYCKKQFGTINLYNNHQCTVKKGKKFDGYGLHCFCCNAILYNCKDFDKHMKVKHFDCAYYCFQCPDRFLTEEQRKRHFTMEHNDTACRFCKKKLSISIKILHEGYHLGLGYPCHKCKKAYMNSRNLSYHNATIHMNGADNEISCNICLKPVKLKTFRGHMKAHNETNARNECHFCGKAFANRTGMEYHTLIYHRSTSSKLKCNICGARFFNKKQLRQHEIIDGCTM